MRSCGERRNTVLAFSWHARWFLPIRDKSADNAERFFGVPYGVAAGRGQRRLRSAV